MYFSMLKLFIVVAVFVAAAQASTLCSRRQEGKCLSKFRHLSEAKDSKEKICRVYHDIEKCLILSHCKLQRYAGLFMAAHDACKGKCELTKVVACKLEVYSDMIKNNGSYCSYHPKYLNCFENTDCKDLKEADDTMMKNYCALG
ncbi:uncharacterized protein LOC106868059 [Octopus bimaculoides]|uniref:uncharacterized protein LOC106868059 n=1 Tax=Octopus bimaculoides TaxID=37653 RepID=UPI00071CECA0|nr:uncharacterized protein LOC106868059 [Octopus bimaculoides]|eukprot:XP_014768658.1 PREDICTED: uncharacterized protein LOC106868059 [Octopus bimaculoides]